MAQDKANFDAVLKTVWGPGIVELIPTKVKTYELFKEKDARDWGGRYVSWPVKIGRNQGVGAATELGAIPTAGKQQYTEARIPMRYVYGRGAFSAQVMKSSQGSKNSYAPAMESEMSGLVKDITAELGRMMLYDGRGVLALLNGSPSTSATITVDSPGGVAGAINGNRFLASGQVLGFINPTTGALRASSNRTIDTYASSGLTATTTATMSGTPVDNDFIVRAMSGTITDVSDTSYQKEPMGLLGLIDDGTYVPTLHGINRTTFPLWSAAVISNVGSISADVIQRGCDIADQRGDGEIDTLIMHHSVRRSYLASMEDGRRYTGGDLSSPNAGTVATRRGTLNFGSIRIMEEKYCPFGVVFGGDFSSAMRFVEVAGEWMDEDGSVLTRVGTGTTATDSFECIYRIWFNTHLDRPNQSFRLDNVTATVAVVHVD